MKYLAAVLVLFLMSETPAFAFYQLNIIFDKKYFIEDDSKDQPAQKTGQTQKKKMPGQHLSPKWIIGFTNPMS